MSSPNGFFIVTETNTAYFSDFATFFLMFREAACSGLPSLPVYTQQFAYPVKDPEEEIFEPDMSKKILIPWCEYYEVEEDRTQNGIFDAETKKYRVPESYIKLAIESQLRDGE